MRWRASARQAATQAGSRAGAKAATTGDSSDSWVSAASLCISMAPTVLVIDQPCKGVPGEKPGAVRRASRRPW